MSLKHKRTKACAISKKTKEVVYRRDGGLCIFCNKAGLPEAHVVPRAQGGLGREENIITVCRECHDKLDNSICRKEMLAQAAGYLKRFYPDWKRESFIFDKWRKDKGESEIKIQNDSIYQRSEGGGYKKAEKDKGEPPDGFTFL